MEEDEGDVFEIIAEQCKYEEKWLEEKLKEREEQKGGRN